MPITIITQFRTTADISERSEERAMPITTRVDTTCVIIQFRATADISERSEMDTLRALISDYGGLILGTRNDGFDVVAGFDNEYTAKRFMRGYFRGEQDFIWTYLPSRVTL